MSSPPAKRSRREQQTAEGSTSGANDAEHTRQQDEAAAAAAQEERKDEAASDCHSSSSGAAVAAAGSAAAASSNSASSASFLHVSQWSDEQKQQRADADAQELYDAHVWPSQLAPHLQLLFSGDVGSLPAMPSVLVDMIAEMALPPPDAAAPLSRSSSVYTLIRIGEGKDGWTEVRTFFDPVALRHYLLLRAQELQQEREQAPEPPLDQRNWEELVQLLNEVEDRGPTSTEVRKEHIRVAQQ